MNKSKKLSILFLRVTLGALHLYAGIEKLINPEWSAAGFLNNASTFPGLYSWFASDANIGWVNFLNAWGLTLIGASLIIGLWVKYASLGGIAMMVLYYFPGLDFPIAGEHGFIIDDHIVHIAAFWLLIKFNAGQYWGLDRDKK